MMTTAQIVAADYRAQLVSSRCPVVERTMQHNELPACLWCCDLTAELYLLLHLRIKRKLNVKISILYLVVLIDTIDVFKRKLSYFKHYVSFERYIVFRWFVLFAQYC
jgi:hypothetical protein